MDKHEAKALLADKLREYRVLTYEQLRARVGDQDNLELTGQSGTEYQTEVQFFWDHKPGGDIRVMGAIDDGGWRAYFPLTDDFIRAPDGSFVGENAT